MKKIEVTKVGGQTQIACTVAIRVAPWSGKDGGEKWEANRPRRRAARRRR